MPGFHSSQGEPLRASHEQVVLRGLSTKLAEWRWGTSRVEQGHWTGQPLEQGGWEKPVSWQPGVQGRARVRPSALFRQPDPLLQSQAMHTTHGASSLKGAGGPARRYSHILVPRGPGSEESLLPASSPRPAGLVLTRRTNPTSAGSLHIPGAQACWKVGP